MKGSNSGDQKVGVIEILSFDTKNDVNKVTKLALIQF